MPTTNKPESVESDTSEAVCRWIPWLAAYTGARFSELVRLRHEDCRRDDEGWSIALRDSDSAGPRGRTVPLHPHLIELGFGAFVDGRPPGPLFLAKENGQNASFVKLAKTAQRASKLGARQLRGRFVIKMRTAGATREVIDMILGSAVEHNKFGFEPPLSHLRQAIEKLPRLSVDD